MKTNKQKIISYIVIIASILLVAVLGSVFVNLGMDWFSSLETPSKFVPSFIIPIVWTIIYVVFAIVSTSFLVVCYVALLLRYCLRDLNTYPCRCMSSMYLFLR